MQKISWTDRVRNKQVLHRDKEERNMLQTIKGWKSNWNGHIWSRKFLIKHVTEGKIEIMGSPRRRRKQLLDDFKRTRRYCK